MLLSLICFTLLATAQTHKSLASNWPNLIIPLNSSNPTAAYGTQYAGVVAFTPGVNGGDQIITEIVFDNVHISTDPPPSRCSIVFYFDVNAPNTLAGIPQFDIFIVPVINGYFMSQSDSYNQHPTYKYNLLAASVKIENGAATILENDIACKDGKNQFVIQPAAGLSQPFYFDWFELNDPRDGMFQGITLQQWE